MDLPQGKNIGEELGRLRKEAEERDALRRAKQENLPYINLSSVPVNLDVLKIISEDKARSAKAAAIDSKHKEIALAVYDHKNPKTQELIKELESLGSKVSLFVSSLRGLERVWERYMEVKAAPEEGALQEVGIEKPEIFKGLVFENVSPKIQELEKRTSGVVTTELVDFILGAAITLGASDVHLETEKTAVLLRFRVDGLLYDVCRLNPKTYSLF